MKYYNKFKFLKAQQGAKLPIFYGPAKEACEYGDCSKWVTDESSRLFKVPRSAAEPEDAWYKRAKVLKAGGREVYNASNPIIHADSLQVGDNVAMAGSAINRSLLPSKTGLTLEDNYNNSHVGMIVGKAEGTGHPLVRHRSGMNIKVDTLSPKNLNYLGIKSIFRPKAFEGKQPDISKEPYYKKYDGVANVMYSPKTTPTIIGDTDSEEWKDNAKLYSEAINRNINDVGRTTMHTPDEMRVLGNMAVGLFGSESKFDTSSSRKPKEILKRAAYNLLKPFGVKISAPSSGPTRIKYKDDIKNADGTSTELLKAYSQVGVHDDNLDDYDQSSKATLARLSHMYSKVKKHKTYDAETGTVYGDIPVEDVVIDRWSRGSTNKARQEVLRKKQADYVKSVRDNMSVMTGGKDSVFPRILKEVVITKPKK